MDQKCIEVYSKQVLGQHLLTTILHTKNVLLFTEEADGVLCEVHVEAQSQLTHRLCAEDVHIGKVRGGFVAVDEARRVLKFRGHR